MAKPKPEREKGKGGEIKERRRIKERRNKERESRGIFKAEFTAEDIIK